MCGIAGIVGIKDKNTAAEKINKMNESLKHRGPDAAGFFIDENIAFGHLRLSIIDLSENANQPFFDVTNRYSITFNGEIYNFQEVKNLLPDYPFRTNSDTEVILAAYIKFGSDCLSLLNGMFAFAIWDKERQELFVARDRLGVKPFYYAQTDRGEFVFASEIRAILKSQLILRKLSQRGLYEYLMYQSVYAPLTIVEDIYQLPAGEFGVFLNGKFTTKAYWQIENKPPNKFSDNAEIVKATVKDLLFKSIERRMISDVRLGAFLSGGIDSSAVVTVMSAISDKPIDTFSVNFGEKEFDESYFSNLIAKKYNTNHTSISLSAKDFLQELPNALSSIDAPSGDGINTYIVSKAVKNAGLTVALSGLGGDELFAGYPNFLRWVKMKNGALNKTPDFIRKGFAMAISYSKSSKYQRIADILSADKLNLSNIYPMFRQVFSQQTLDEIYDYDHSDTSIQNILKEKQSEIEKFPLLSQYSIAELLGYTQNVLLKDTDQFSMASALEVREPFFDFQLVEYVLQIPDQIKFPKYPKSLLVEALSPMLPDEIVHRKKMGFVLPWEKWMRHELKDFCENRLKNLADREILNSDNLLERWKHFQNGSSSVLWSHFWHLIVLTEWLENNKF
jgi:asparagine synthase (glutamine-hydrolysing)